MGMGAAEEVCTQEVGHEVHLAQDERDEVSLADQGGLRAQLLCSFSKGVR